MPFTYFTVTFPTSCNKVFLRACITCEANFGFLIYLSLTMLKMREWNERWRERDWFLYFREMWKTGGRMRAGSPIGNYNLTHVCNTKRRNDILRCTFSISPSNRFPSKNATWDFEIITYIAVKMQMKNTMCYIDSYTVE